jgi:hypothetical protein
VRAEILKDTSLLIAHYLANRAGKKLRATYPMVAEEIGWSHPTGRGLTKYLYEILHHCKDHELPPLTTILVKKGTRYPPEDAMVYIRAALGDVDLEMAQREVFEFDWSDVFEEPERHGLIDYEVERSGIWLTSFWGWSPNDWGCLSFSREWMRDRFIQHTEPGVIVAIYVAGSRQSPAKLRNRLVGFYEVTHEIGHLYDFISASRRTEHESDPERRHKFLYSLKASRAWKVDLDLPPFVDDVLPGFVTRGTGTRIGARGLPVTDPDHIANLLRLPIVEVPLFGNNATGRNDRIELNQVAKVSRAVYPPKEPYFIAEPNGPKHLYVMRLSCDPGEWLTSDRTAPAGALIIKVGFSKSPISRCRQIQAAYPAGRFRWEIVYPDPIPKSAPYPDAETAIIGEDAMKQFLASKLERILGGEFFLASDPDINHAWSLGNEAIANAVRNGIN